MQMLNRLLRVQMTLFGDTPADLAEYLGISRQSMMRKLNGLNIFRQDEMFKIKRRYDLGDNEFVKMFETEVEPVES